MKAMSSDVHLDLWMEALAILSHFAVKLTDSVLGNHTTSESAS